MSTKPTQENKKHINHYYRDGVCIRDNCGKKEEERCTKCGSPFQSHHYKIHIRYGVYHTGCSKSIPTPEEAGKGIQMEDCQNCGSYLCRCKIKPFSLPQHKDSWQETEREAWEKSNLVTESHEQEGYREIWAFSEEIADYWISRMSEKIEAERERCLAAHSLQIPFLIEKGRIESDNFYRLKKDEWDAIARKEVLKREYGLPYLEEMKQKGISEGKKQMIEEITKEIERINNGGAGSQIVLDQLLAYLKNIQ